VGGTFWFELELAPAQGADRVAHTRLAERDAAVREGIDGSAPLLLVAQDSPVNRVVAVRTPMRAAELAAVPHSWVAPHDAAAAGESSQQSRPRCPPPRRRGGAQPGP
jgi:hypothetical protein